MPTYDRTNRFRRDYRRLSLDLAVAFDDVLPSFVQAIDDGPPYPPYLRIKIVRGTQGHIWEMSFAGDGRATFEFGEPVTPGLAHVVWRRIGTHSIFNNP